MKKVCSLFLIIVALISCSSCGAPNFVIKKYYRDKSNFKEYTAIVEGYGDFWNESNMIYLDIGSSGGDLQTSSIYLFGENANIARKNQIWDVIRIGSEIVSKALGSEGGFVCGSKLLVEYLRNMSRPFIFSTATGAPAMAAALAALDVLVGKPGRQLPGKWYSL